MNNGYVNLKQQVIDLIGYLRSMLYPEIFGEMGYRSTRALKSEAGYVLVDTLKTVFEDDTDCEAIAEKFFDRLPEIKEILDTDVQAAYEGDPAAKSTKEVMLAYPAFEAISIFRIAHVFYELNVPILPRMMTEYAHKNTGIDIHPGATVGPYFFIDHGTGVVIGETTEIGNNVKLYQGVTLGALSTRKGQLLSGVKRHPTIGDNVTIYSNATILGGETTIGANTTIGGNSFITGPVPANTRVSIKTPELSIKGSVTESKESPYDWTI